jgi:MraZ protein
MRFIGDYTAKTDAKGRVFLPAQFRRVLETEGEDKLVLRNDLFQNCLVLCPESVWNAELDDLKSKLNRYNNKHQMMWRRFVANAELVELDSNGRFLIGKRKLEFAGIKSEVRFLAVDERIEVWDKDALEKVLSEGESLGQEFENLLGDETIL